MFWLRGVDLNHQPLGVEPKARDDAALLLGLPSSPFVRQSGSVRKLPLGEKGCNMAHV
jgi:hypothetical protein